mmetsp:Transcript_16280/g.65792  ORF Transcript_16280/g.65792 Transcript_16280/m.65792 type:complete len:226 (+) Transcript_16280:840-1517(+)
MTASFLRENSRSVRSCARASRRSASRRMTWRSTRDDDDAAPPRNPTHVVVPAAAAAASDDEELLLAWWRPTHELLILLRSAHVDDATAASSSARAPSSLAGLLDVGCSRRKSSSARLSESNLRWYCCLKSAISARAARASSAPERSASRSARSVAFASPARFSASASRSTSRSVENTTTSALSSLASPCGGERTRLASTLFVFAVAPPALAAAAIILVASYASPT